MPEVKELAEKLSQVPWRRVRDFATIKELTPDCYKVDYEALARVALEFCEERGKLKAWKPGEPIGIACRDIKPGETVTLTSGPGGDIQLFPGYMEEL